MAMTYTSLQEDMRRYLQRGNTPDTIVFAQIPRLIFLAQKSIADHFQIQGMLTSKQSTLQAGVYTYAKPDRWRRTVSMFYGGGTAATPLFTRAYTYCRGVYPDVSARDLPKFYSDYDYENWFIVPTPVANYNWEVNYYELPPLLSDSVQTNWVTDYTPNALLYRSLLEAAPFLKNDERIQTWQGMYEDAVSNLDALDVKKIVDSNTTREKAS